jgi:hypothetical protein
MGHATDLSPRWTHRPKTPAESLALHGVGGVAIVDAQAHVLVLDEKGKAGEPYQLTSLAVTDSSPFPRTFPLGDGWLASLGEPELALCRPGRKKAQPFAEGDAPVLAFSVSLDGVAVARRGSVELWTHAGKRKWRCVTEGAYVAVALSGSTFLALSDDGALTSHSVISGEPKETLRLATTESSDTWRLSLAGKERALLALGEHVVVVDTTTMKVVRRVKARARIILLASDAEGGVVGFEDGFVQGVDVQAGEAGAPLPLHPEKPVHAFVLGKTTLFTTCGKEVRAWDRAVLGMAAESKSPITAISAVGPLVVAGDRAGVLRVLSGDKELARVSLGQEITALRAVSDTLVVAVTARVLVRLSSPFNLPKILALRSAATAFAADAHYAFVGSEEGTVDVYDLEANEHLTRYSLSDADISALALLPSGKLAVGTGAIDGRVFVVDAVAAEVLHRVEAHDEAFGVTCIAAEPRGRLIASGSDDGSVALIDPAKGKVLARVRLPETPASIAFEASGKRFVCTFADGKAAVVDLAARARVSSLDLRGATQVAWGTSPMFGHADGRVAAYTV